MAPPSRTRPYRKRKRAEREETTRRRITEAAVELHGTRGPARTSVTDVAKRAGVSRMTVYTHFPTDADLFRACSTHWASENPFPDPARWASIDDPAQRLSTGLRELYRWYGLKQDMLVKVMGDMPVVPALAEVMGGFWLPYLEGIVETLSAGWSPKQGRTSELCSALRLTVDFGTWKTLADSGLSDSDAADLAARMVAAVVAPGG